MGSRARMLCPLICASDSVSEVLHTSSHPRVPLPFPTPQEMASKLFFLEKKTNLLNFYRVAFKCVCCWQGEARHNVSV